MDTQKPGIHQLLSAMLANNSSSMQLRVGHPPMFRTDGDVHESAMPVVRDAQEMKVLLIELIGSAPYDRFERELQCSFPLEFAGHAFELHLMRSHGQVAAGMQRIVNRVLTLAELQAPSIFQRICEGMPSGLVLVNGGAFSGWRTTLAAMRHEVLQLQKCSVMTLGSNRFPAQSSTQGLHTSVLVGPGHDAQSYEDALKPVEKMDVDYLFVMESLCQFSSEAVRRIVRLAQSNTLVVANLDVDSTESALRQLLWLLEHPDRELAQDQVASALRVCTCQRLLRSADRSSMLTCHEILDVSPEMRTAIRNFDLERIGRTLASHSISSSMKRAAKMLLDKGLIHADQYEKV